MRLWIRPRLGVLEVTGTLGGGSRLMNYIHILDWLRRSRMVRGVVLEIDSPGGLVTSADYLFTAASRLASQKPLVAFIRGTGASGAYMLASAAHKIVALPSALVGSIGVISIRPAVPELLQKIGVKVNVAKGGRLKDMGGFWREPTPEEEQKDQSLVLEYYEGFIEAVARARKLDPAKVRELATGEVFTAKRGLDLGLVDELGDGERALDLAAEMARIPRRYFYARPPRSWRERLLGSLASSLVEEATAQLFNRFYYLG
jgi:protease-4